MKLWKRWLTLLTALLVSAALAACTPADDPTESSDSVQDTTAAPAQDTTAGEETSDYSEFLGTWYSGGAANSARLVLEEDGSWELKDADGKRICGGSFVLTDNGLELLDGDGTLALLVMRSAQDSLYTEVYLQSLQDAIADYNFSRTTVTVGEVDETFGTEDILIEETLAEDIPADIIPTSEETVPSMEEPAE